METYQTIGAETTVLENDATLEDLRCEGRKKESEFTIKRERYHRIILWIIQKMTKFTNARGRRKRCTRTSSGHALHTNASFSLEAAQIEREREDSDHPLVSKAAQKGIPLKNARVLPTSSHSRPKKKRAQISSSRNSSANYINAPSVGRNRRLNRRDDSTRG